MGKQKPDKNLLIPRSKKPIAAVDLFCGAGGLTRGLMDEGISVVMGVDVDLACQFPYEKNNGVKFLKSDVSEVKSGDLIKLFPENSVRVLVGCAPCQPFSKYTQGLDSKAHAKWGLLHSFAKLIEETEPDIVSMENVPQLKKHTIFEEFVEMLKKLKYHVSHSVVYCPAYGLPQQRSRLVLFASKFGPIEIIKPTHVPSKYPTVKEAIGHLPAIGAGSVHPADPLHRSAGLSNLNLKRIRASKPAGTWRDWTPSLVASCHKRKKGKSYPSVYGRMAWDAPAPTITTQFFGFGNGRFGHPEQDRAISLREGAILQSFPKNYVFAKRGLPYSKSKIGELIGNAVPVKLGRVVGRTIRQHLDRHGQ